VWTTFSADQVDLDYRNPAVLVRMLDVLLTYVAHGANVIRLDAVGFLWKEEGSPSIHLPETHRIIQFFRACLDACDLGVILITETNVPHEENLSYLRDRTHPEANAVYQFPLPPLMLSAFTTGDATQLVAWLAALETPREGTTYLNFLSSHDGVGLRPLEGLIGSADLELLVAQAEANGGSVSSRTDGDGTRVPYELNATWFDLIRGPTTGEDALARHLASHAVMFALRGIPALYVQSLLAGENDVAGVTASGRARSINRRRFVDGDLDELGVRLSDSGSAAARSVAALRQMIELRTSSAAFHPEAGQTILDTPAQVIGIERRPEANAAARVYVNVSGTSVTIPGETDRVSAGNRWSADAGVLELGPWGYVWILE
jgi:sucrose phosphorylase